MVRVYSEKEVLCIGRRPRALMHPCIRAVVEVGELLQP